MARYRDEEWGEEKRSGRSGSGGSWIKCFIFIILLIGASAGALIGIFGLDEMKSWFGIGSDAGGDIPSDTPSDTGGDSGGDTGGGGDPVTPVPVDPNACNGLLSNCNMKANELLWASVHNSNHHTDPFPNNKEPLEDALEAGYRALMIDVCKCPLDGGGYEIIFCHGFCNVGNRDPTEVFTNIGTFLDNNPKEVLLFNFELSDSNSGIRPTPQELWDVIPNNGLKNKTYRYQGGEWPTLQTLLDDGKQSMMFKHSGPVCNDGVEGCVNKISEFHAFALETKYAFSGVDEVENTANSCSGDRGTDGTKDFMPSTILSLPVLGGFLVRVEAKP